MSRYGALRSSIRRDIEDAANIKRSKKMLQKAAQRQARYTWPTIEKDSLAYLWLRWIRHGQTSLLTVTNLQASRNPQTRMAAQQVAEFCQRPDWRLYV